ncbi:unnamed protein product [Rotaria sp. Silwood2]|nr:unnamed protein product [Rotaria sp. Silwood2]
MKGFLHSQDGSYAFPLGPKVTTIGRENCDISINSPQVDNQHALIEYDDEQRCFILKDLNSSTGTYVHDCRVQNAAVRLNHGDFIRFGFNGLPLEFRIEQQQQQLETTMPSIYQRQSSSNSLQLITQTIPSRRVTSGITNHQQQIDVRQNPGFSLRYEIIFDHNTFTRKLIQLLDINDDTVLNVSPLATMPTTDRYVALQQRQRVIEMLLQKIEMLRERLTRKEDLLHDYENDLGKLRQAEILLREKDFLLQDLETDKRSKDDEALFLRNTLKETEDHLNQEKRLNSSIKHGRNIDQPQSNELIRRSGTSTTLQNRYSTDPTTKVRTIKRDMNQKICRKDYEIKTLKQELHEALDTLSEQSNKVKLLELQSKVKRTKILF